MSEFPPKLQYKFCAFDLTNLFWVAFSKSEQHSATHSSKKLARTFPKTYVINSRPMFWFWRSKILGEGRSYAKWINVNKQLTWKVYKQLLKYHMKSIGESNTSKTLTFFAFQTCIEHEKFCRFRFMNWFHVKYVQLFVYFSCQLFVYNLETHLWPNGESSDLWWTFWPAMRVSRPANPGWDWFTFLDSEKNYKDENYACLISRYFNKNFVKATIPLEKLLKSWFHRIFCLFSNEIPCKWLYQIYL